MLSSVLCTILTFFLLLAVAASSAITTYTDATCKTSFNNLDVVNGYPDGVCTPLKIIGNLKTFQIAKLDPGCAVTLYGSDESELTCSSSLKIVGEFGTCYNSSWVYYSVDNCLPPTSSYIILPTSTPTSTPSPTPSASGTKKSYTGYIVGGIVAGVAVVAIVFGFVLFCLYRRRRNAKAQTDPPSYELSIDHTRQEAEANAAVVRSEKPSGNEHGPRTELWGHDAAAEIGRNSLYIPPAELPGDAVVQDDKKGLAPLVKANADR